ncbi:MAG: SufD family Fe-S cluster assembly protein [Ureaplasma sp.]|nr:SufD family Fe-S cluster assembly protein [Ureaplasma sp.]
MENNFKFIKKEFALSLFVNKDTTQNLFCVLKEDANININVDIQKDVKFSLNVVIYSYQNAIVNINVKTNSFFDKSENIVNINAIANDNSSMNIKLDSMIPENINFAKISQNIKGILLSENSRILGIPQLTVNSDQVIANHALNIGGMNEEELFYLMSKGFNEQTCKKIILNGFIKLSLNSLSENKQNKYLKKLNKLIKKDQ